MIVISGFSFIAEDINFMLCGGCLQTCEAFSVDCDDDGTILEISWDNGRGRITATDSAPFNRQLFETLSEAIAMQCSTTIQDHIAETAERIRERAADRRAELAMGK